MTTRCKFLVFFLFGMLTWTAEAQSVNPDYQAGLTNYDKRDWDGAISNFTKAIQANDDLYDCYSYRSYSLAEKGDASGARADCRQIVTLEPTWAGSYYWCSRVEVVCTNYEVALQDFEIGLRIDPKNRPNDLGWSLIGHYMDSSFKEEKIGKLDVALSEINKALDLNLTNSGAYTARAWLRVLEGHFDGAISDVDIAIKYDPQNPFSYEILAWARYGRGDVSGAVEAIKKGIGAWQNLSAIRPDEREMTTDELLLLNGLLCFINDDFKGAADDWEKHLDKNGKIMPQPVRTFLQSWIDKAKARDGQSISLTATNNSPTPDGR